MVADRKVNCPTDHEHTATKTYKIKNKTLTTFCAIHEENTSISV